MRPSSDNAVMSLIVNGYAMQQSQSLGYDVEYANSWKVFDGEDYIIKDLDLSEVNEWLGKAKGLLEDKIVWGVFYITYQDGHKALSFAFVDMDLDGNPLRLECVEVSDDCLIYHVLDDDGDKIIETDQSVDGVLSMLTALSNINNVVDALSAEQKAILAKFAINGSGALLIESKAEFGSDVEVDGSLTLNSASDIVMKDGSKIGGGTQVVLRRY